MVLKRAILGMAMMSLTLTGFADTLRLRNGQQISGIWEGGTSRIIRFRSDSGVQEYDILTVSAVQIGNSTVTSNVEVKGSRKVAAESGSSFGPQQEYLIRDWFSRSANNRNLPPGLAKRETLPPGLQRQLQRNGTLPPGLQKRAQPLPIALEEQLPPLPAGLRRVVITGNVMLLEVSTGRIIDLIREVF
jgi:hypothetical protein